jgi:hypothetical protein
MGRLPLTLAAIQPFERSSVSTCNLTSLTFSLLPHVLPEISEKILEDRKLLLDSGAIVQIKVWQLPEALFYRR